LLEQHGYQLTDEVAELGARLGDVLIAPTRIYVKPILAMLEQVNIKGMAHITGGGFIENIPRVLPEGVNVEIEMGSWPVLPKFAHMQQLGNISHTDMYTTFNMGIGMVLVVAAEDVEQVLTVAAALNEPIYRIGQVTEGSKIVTFKGAGA
jgi:phosphoribosylformylglycinamidine cyclo-ligase